MRNLKRALSLTLASVMLLGMMVVGANAASYPDVSEEDNIEAIEVLQAVKVMVGDDNGNFGPEQPVNRSQMAVVMALLLNLDYDYYEGTNPFWDVPSWAEPYVAACYANGIVSGYNAYEYGAGDPVTAVQAASMMMRALGYFQYASDYKDGFELSTVKQASKIALFKDINANATDALTRNQVAQLALNTLKADMVDAVDNTFNITSSTGDATISATGGQVIYQVRTSVSDFARAIDSTTQEGNSIDGRQGSIIQLGEQLYQGELKLIDNPGHVDAFGRPARTWEYKGQEIGTYAKKEQLKTQYTEKVTGKMLYDLLGSNTIKTYDVFVTIDGEDDRANNPAVFDETAMNRTNDKKVGETGNGVLTQVYVDTENKDIYIAIVNTYLAIASDDYNEKKDTANLDVYKLSNPSNGLYLKDTSSNPPYDVNDLDVTGDDFNIENVQEGDMFLVTVANGVIKSMVEPEVLTNEVITTYSRNSYVTVDGNRHDYATTAAYDEDVMDNYNDGDMKNVTYNIILDQYGYLIGVEEYNAVDNYVFMTGIEDDFSKLSKKNVEANVIFLDGSMETITVDKAESTLEDDNFSISEAAQVNRWYTYGVDNDGIYTLELVDTTGASGKKVSQSLVNLDGYIPETKEGDGDDVAAEIRNINTKNISLPGGSSLTNVYGNDETVYINTVTAGIPSDAYTNSLIIDDVDSVTVGIGNVDLKVIGLGEGDAHVPTKYTKTIKGTAYTCPDGEIYALYHNEGKEAGYIIGVVTLDAEDSNTSTIYAFMNTNKIDRRSYDDSTGKWTWYREAVIDGEISELAYTNTTQSSLGSDGNLESLTRGEWYEVKLKADGTVKSAEPITYVANTYPVNTTNIGTHDITQIGASADAVNKDFIFQGVYAQGGEANLTYKSNTLYTDTTQTKGIYVDKNAKIVVFVENFDDKDTFTDMTKALKFLNDAENFEGRLNAVVDKNGRAQVVILDERSTAPTEPMTITINLVGDDKADLGTVTVEWDGQDPITSATLTTDGVRVDDGLAALGYTEPGTPNSYNGTFVAGGSATTTFTYEAGEPETLEYTSVLPEEDWDDDDIDTDVFAFADTGEFAISGLEITKFNAVYPKSTLKTQLTEYLESQGYSDVKDIAYSGNADGSSGTGYTFTATGEDDISRPMYVLDSTIKWYARLTLDGETHYLDDGNATMSDLDSALTGTSSTGMYAKDLNAKTASYVALDESSNDLPHGGEYESGYWKISLASTNPLVVSSLTDVTATNCGIAIVGADTSGNVYVKSTATSIQVKLTLVADASSGGVTLDKDNGAWLVENGKTSTEIAVGPDPKAFILSGDDTETIPDKNDVDSGDANALEITLNVTLSSINSATKDTTIVVTLSDT